MNTATRVNAYTAQRNGGVMTAKQQRRVIKKDRQAANRKFAPVAKLVTTVGAHLVKAKVGAITYTGRVIDIIEGQVFEYVTSKGDVKTAMKFTVLDD